MRRALKYFSESWSNSEDDRGPLQTASVDIVDEDMANGVVFTSGTGGNNTLINWSTYIVRDGWENPLGSIETIDGYVIHEALRL